MTQDLVQKYKERLAPFVGREITLTYLPCCDQPPEQITGILNEVKLLQETGVVILEKSDNTNGTIQRIIPLESLTMQI